MTGNFKKNLDTLINMFSSDKPRWTLLEALFNHDVEDDGWVSAALNSDDKNILNIAKEFFIADALEDEDK